MRKNLDWQKAQIKAGEAQMQAIQQELAELAANLGRTA